MKKLHYTKRYIQMILVIVMLLLLTTGCSVHSNNAVPERDENLSQLPESIQKEKNDDNFLPDTDKTTSGKMQTPLANVDDLLLNADIAMGNRDAETATYWLNETAELVGETTDIRNRREIIDRFNGTCWVLYLGNAFAQNTMFAVFDIDGTYDAVSWDDITWIDEGNRRETYSYENGILTIMGIPFGWNEAQQGFQSITMADRPDEDGYFCNILPDENLNYLNIVGSEAYKNAVEKNW